jgi:hypothetical protein
MRLALAREQAEAVWVGAMSYDTNISATWGIQYRSHYLW